MMQSPEKRAQASHQILQTVYEDVHHRLAEPPRVRLALLEQTLDAGDSALIIPPRQADPAQVFVENPRAVEVPDVGHRALNFDWFACSGAIGPEGRVDPLGVGDLVRPNIVRHMGEEAARGLLKRGMHANVFIQDYLANVHDGNVVRILHSLAVSKFPPGLE